MSQEYNDTSKRSRRARSQRNRPVLVTTTTEEQAEELAPRADTLVAETEPQAEATPAPKESRRRLSMPSFFSTVGKSADEPESTGKEVDVAQARLARATRGKGTAPANKAAAAKTQEQDAAEEEKKPARPAPAQTRPARPQSAFKTKYIIGIGVYLLAANFVGPFEMVFLRNMHADNVLTKFNLFGGTVAISTSTLLFLATLVIILVVLAKLDLIPRNLAALAGTPPPSRAGQSQSKPGNSSPGVRNIPPAMRQGVKGADDHLYQEYRANQRREKRK